MKIKEIIQQDEIAEGVFEEIPLQPPVEITINETVKKPSSLKQQFQEKKLQKQIKQKRIIRNINSNPKKHMPKETKNSYIESSDEIAAKAFKNSTWEDAKEYSQHALSILLGYHQTVAQCEILMQDANSKVQQNLYKDENDAKLKIMGLANLITSYKRDMANLSNEYKELDSILKDKTGKLTKHDVDEYISFCMNLNGFIEKIQTLFSSPMENIFAQANLVNELNKEEIVNV